MMSLRKLGPALIVIPLAAALVAGCHSAPVQSATPVWGNAQPGTPGGRPLTASDKELLARLARQAAAMKAAAAAGGATGGPVTQPKAAQ